MNLLFTVEITVKVPDPVVADTLQIATADLPGADLDCLAIGHFGDLQLVRGNEPEGHLGTVLGYTTQQYVEKVG